MGSEASGEGSARGHRLQSPSTAPAPAAQAADKPTGGSLAGGQWAQGLQTSMIPVPHPGPDRPLQTWAASQWVQTSRYLLASSLGRPGAWLQLTFGFWSATGACKAQTDPCKGRNLCGPSARVCVCQAPRVLSCASTEATFCEHRCAQWSGWKLSMS